MTIRVGDSFPSFTGLSQDRQEVDLAKYRGDQGLVVFFYPKAMTSGCVRETTEFGAREGELAAAGAKVVGISVDDPEAQKKHAIECAASFPVLSDQDRRLSTELDILNERSNAKRTTYVIDRTGVVREIFDSVNVDGHVDQVLASVKKLPK